MREHFFVHLKESTQILTAWTKKSLCRTLTTPKLVNLNTRSIIHMIFGRTSGFELKQAINNGTSAVLWWLANNNVRVPFVWHTVISSPDSTTINHRNEQKIRLNYSGSILFFFFFLSTKCPKSFLDRFVTSNKIFNCRNKCTYCHNQPTMAMTIRRPTANGKIILLFYYRYVVDIAWAATIASSISHMSVYNKCCSQWQPLYELWLLDKVYIF